jgi:hypothetical protein
VIEREGLQKYMFGTFGIWLDYNASATPEEEPNVVH